MNGIPGTQTATFYAGMLEERERQREKWGEQTHAGHTWMSILGEEFGEACKAVNEDNPEQALLELTHVAAVASAAAEQYIRGDGGLRPTYGICKQTPAQALAREGE